MNDILKLAIPHKGYIVTPLLLYANIGIFAAMLASDSSMLFHPDSDMLMAWGANHRAATLGGSWWRLVSYNFLHIGPLHLLGNMFSLLLAGLLVEPLVGSARMLLLYLLCGIAAGLGSIGWYADTPSVGASGAICGLFGISLALMQKRVFPTDFIIAFLISVASAIGSGVLMTLGGENIDNAAHFAGLLCGYLTGLLVAIPLARKKAAEDAALLQQGTARLAAYRAKLAEEKERKKQEQLDKEIIRW